MVYDVYGLWFLDCWLLIWVLKLVSSGLWCLWSFIPQWESSKSASTYIYIALWKETDDHLPRTRYIMAYHPACDLSWWYFYIIIVFIFIQSIYTVYICIIYDICVYVYPDSYPVHRWRIPMFQWLISRGSSPGEGPEPGLSAEGERHRAKRSQVPSKLEAVGCWFLGRLVRYELNGSYLSIFSIRCSKLLKCPSC